MSTEVACSAQNGEIGIWNFHSPEYEIFIVTKEVTDGGARARVTLDDDGVEARVTLETEKMMNEQR